MIPLCILNILRYSQYNFFRTDNHVLESFAES